MPELDLNRDELWDLLVRLPTVLYETEVHELILPVDGPMIDQLFKFARRPEIGVTREEWAAGTGVNLMNTVVRPSSYIGEGVYGLIVCDNTASPGRHEYIAIDDALLEIMRRERCARSAEG